MRYLIDTNIFVYIAQDYSSLSREVLDILSDYSNTLHMSAESVKELIVAYNNKGLLTKKWKTADEMVAITNKLPLISSDRRFPFYIKQGLDLIYNER